MKRQFAQNFNLDPKRRHVRIHVINIKKHVVGCFKIVSDDETEETVIYHIVADRITIIINS